MGVGWIPQRAGLLSRVIDILSVLNGCYRNNTIGAFYETEKWMQQTVHFEMRFVSSKYYMCRSLHSKENL